MSEPTTIEVKHARAVANVGAIQKSRTANAGSYTYTYASLSDVLAAVHDACTAEGLSVSQYLVSTGERMQGIVTRFHCLDTGVTLDSPGPLFPIINEAQAAGSQLTYMRRYALVLAMGLNVTDDDGAQAQRATAKPKQRTEAEQQIRAMIADMDDDTRTAFIADFKDVFTTGLSDLPESRHGDALTWAHWWLDQDETEQPMDGTEGETE